MGNDVINLTKNDIQIERSILASHMFQPSRYDRETPDFKRQLPISR